MNKKTLEVKIGSIGIGGNNPIRIQSMTNTQTSDINATISQIKELILAGSELVRITINNDEAAKAVPKIIEKLNKEGIFTPIIGDFHFNGHILLEKYPDMAKSISKYRINPGNVGKGNKKDENFEKIISIAIKYNKPIRIGINGGSLDEELLSKNMNKNSKLKNPKSYKDVFVNSLVESAIISAKRAEEIGLKSDKIILSVKASDINEVIKANELLSSKTNYPLHLGLTEAGGGIKGIVASSSALGILLNKGIGNTIRVSITPEPGTKREREVFVCKYLLQTMGFRHFEPSITSCPGCGRTNSTRFQELTKKVSEEITKRMSIWKEKFEGFEKTNIAIMGCIVNGPGESKNADIGISFPGSGEGIKLPVYVKGKFYKNLEGNSIFEDFMIIIEEYFIRHYNKNP